MQSRSSIRPDDHGAWFASYTAFISHYAAMAQRLGVEQFAVGSELASISDDRARLVAGNSRSTGSVSRHRAVCGRTRRTARVPFWDALDMIGIDAYWPLSTAPTTNVSVLQRRGSPSGPRWLQVRQDTAARSCSPRPATRARRGPPRVPMTDLGTPPNESEQAAAYQACWRPSATAVVGGRVLVGLECPARQWNRPRYELLPSARPPNR